MFEDDIRKEEQEIPAVENVPVVAEKTDEEYLSEINRLQEEYRQYQKAKKEDEEKQLQFNI